MSHCKYFLHEIPVEISRGFKDKKKKYYLVSNFHTADFILFSRGNYVDVQTKHTLVKNKFNFNILTKCEIPQSFNCKLVQLQ